MSENSANLQGGQNTEDKQENQGKINYHSSGIVERDDSVLLTNVREQMDKAAEEARQIKAEARQRAKEEKANAKQDPMSQQVREAKKAVKFTRRQERSARIKEALFGGKRKIITFSVIALIIALIVGIPATMFAVEKHEETEAAWAEDDDSQLSADQFRREVADAYFEDGDIAAARAKFEDKIASARNDLSAFHYKFSYFQFRLSVLGEKAGAAEYLNSFCTDDLDSIKQDKCEYGKALLENWNE